MNLTHPAAAAAAHRGLGMAGHNGLGMHAHGGYTTGHAVHQRSPFAIQELLGLTTQQDNVVTSRPLSHHHSDTVISASSYIPRTLSGPMGQGSCLPDPNNPTHPYSSWRPGFMAFSAPHAAQNMLNMNLGPMSQPTLPNPHSHSQTSPTSSHTGKNMQ
jgi:hypothetical protein